MEIVWHGLTCFTLKGKTGTLVTDPFDAKVAGIATAKLEADVCIANERNPSLHAVEALGKEVKIFDWPGEYEAKNIVVQGILAYDRPREKDSSKKDLALPVIVYSLNMDGFKICHLSTLGHKLTPEMLEMIGSVDILFVPIGGGVGLDAKKAHEVIEQVDPRIVIPMYYKTPGVKLDLAPLEPFLKEMGLHNQSAEKVLKFQAPSALPQERTEFKIMEPVGG